MKSIVLFRNNLRLNDNPVLSNLPDKYETVPIYIYDNANIKKQLGGASKYWLYQALISLNNTLNGSNL